MLDLLDYRRQVAENYRRVREQGTTQAYEQFRRERDTLFRSHSQSALDEEQKAAFQGLRYCPLRSSVSRDGESRDATSNPSSTNMISKATGIPSCASSRR